MKLLFVLLGTIGDMILFSAIIESVKKKYSNASIHVLGSKRNFTILENHPDVSRIFIFDKSPFKLLALRKSLKSENYDYWIDVKDHYSTESMLLAKMSNAKTKIGFNEKSTGPFDLSVPSFQENLGKHFVEVCFNALKHLDIEKPTVLPLPQVFTDSESDSYVANFTRTLNGKPIILINISASQLDRQYSTKNWIAVINELDKRMHDIVLIYAPEDDAKAAEILASCEKIFVFKSRSIHDAFSLIKTVDLLVSPDTSLIHAAGAFGVNVVALYLDNKEFFPRFASLSKNIEIIMPNEPNQKVNDISYQTVIQKIFKSVRKKFPF